MEVWRKLVKYREEDRWADRRKEGCVELVNKLLDDPRLVLRDGAKVEDGTRRVGLGGGPAGVSLMERRGFKST